MHCRIMLTRNVKETRNDLNEACNWSSTELFKRYNMLFILISQRCRYKYAMLGIDSAFFVLTYLLYWLCADWRAITCNFHRVLSLLRRGSWRMMHKHAHLLWLFFVNSCSSTWQRRFCWSDFDVLVWHNGVWITQRLHRNVASYNLMCKEPCSMLLSPRTLHPARPC